MLLRLLLGTAIPTAAVAAADLCTDDTCLTESATMLQVGGGRATGRTGQAAGLYAATLKLLRTGATPETVTFAEEAVTDIEDTVYPAMEEAHRIDQENLRSKYEEFSNITVMYQAQYQKLQTHATTVTQRLQEHKTCRGEQLTKCNLYHIEEQKRELRWDEFKDADEVFTSKTDEQQWCGDSETDMEAQHTTFQSYESAGKSRFEAWDAHESQRIIALDHYEKLQEQARICNQKQSYLEDASCERYSEWEAAQELLNGTWHMIVEGYQKELKSVQEKTADRNAEFSTLEEVKCLLTNIKDRGGEPCEEQQDGTSDQATGVIQSCRNQTHTKFVIHQNNTRNPPDLLAEPSKPCDDKFEDEYSSYLNNTKCFENFECTPCVTV